MPFLFTAIRGSLANVASKELLNERPCKFDSLEKHTH